MQGKTFFIDMTKCTACRGCQVSCKQWKNLPAVKTKNWGSHQNPPSLTPVTFKLVRFNEVNKDGKIRWNFMPEQCRHCVEPSCKLIMNMYVPNSVEHDAKTGAVLYTDKTATIDLEPWEMCPYNVPRRDEKTGVWSKCNMCIDRVQNGMKPACVRSCAMGVMQFGDREEMLAIAYERLAEVRKKHKDAFIADPDDVRVLFLGIGDPADYYEYLSADTAGL